MSGLLMVSAETPALLEFRGPDALRYLNGQLTQDVRRVMGAAISLPSCVTDAKGRLQFRVTVHEADGGAVRVVGPPGVQEALEARLTRYLIADDVEVVDLTGKLELLHFIGSMKGSNDACCRESKRYGVDGTDWWIPRGDMAGVPPHVVMPDDELEALRIQHGVPLWGRELFEGMLPPEALLDATDISYHKGCYVGQEVISRIKSAGKVNRRLTRFGFAPDAPVVPGPLVDAEGKPAGELTSVSPLVSDGPRGCLGYLKRGAAECFYRAGNGSMVPARVL